MFQKSAPVSAKGSIVTGHRKNTFPENYASCTKGIDVKNNGIIWHTMDMRHRPQASWKPKILLKPKKKQ